MIGMVMAVNEVFDWLRKALRKFPLEPLSRITIEGIGGNDSIGSYQEYRKVELVLEPVGARRSVC